MKDKATPELDPLDLAIRARRGSLTEREREAFAQALGASATIRMSHELGTDFDLALRVKAGDEALLERALDRALTPRAARRTRRKSLGIGLLAAAIVVASAAAATRGGLVPPGTFSAARSAGPPARGTGPRPTAPAPRPQAGLPPSAPAPSADRVPAREGSAVAHAPLLPLREGAPPPAPAAQAAAVTAATLFGEAGAARRAGDLSRARALYGELQARFPDSNESRVSSVSLGKLLLSSGHAREAEAAFATYLRAGAGDLGEEALVGRADALLALGRTADERNVRRELLSRYPTSVYASHARVRLAEIDAAGDGK